ncbi:MAG TPA: hypothetical protein VG942_18800 [Hyphomonadaceae bacterium]|nr:hypothetical protein [Hyphomonadaceae bacterium]
MPQQLIDGWNAFAANFGRGWPHNWDETPSFIVALLEISWVRWIGLLLIVYLTIRVIASVYSGDKQNSELGPVGIRPHVAKKFGDDTIRLPSELMPMNMDGVAARCRVYYVYSDARGRRRKILLHTIHDSRMSVSPVRIPRIKNMIFGEEIPDVPTEYVCFPPVDTDEADTTIAPTPARATDYATLHKLIDKWTEDDNAPTVTTSQDVLDEIATAKITFVEEAVRKQEKAKSTFVARNLHFRRLYQSRPNVIGSYYLKFQFSHDPWFVLTKHPDKDLKMTAWLTVLTSMFALVMDAWPKEAGPFRSEVPGEHSVAPDAPAHVVKVVPPG